METGELKQIALATARNIKTQQDLAEFQQVLTKVTVSAKKVIYLAIQEASKKWRPCPRSALGTIHIRNWKDALNDASRSL